MDNYQYAKFLVPIVSISWVIEETDTKLEFTQNPTRNSRIDGGV